jgi:hypothetical protein
MSCAFGMCCHRTKAFMSGSMMSRWPCTTSVVLHDSLQFIVSTGSREAVLGTSPRTNARRQSAELAASGASSICRASRVVRRRALGSPAPDRRTRIGNLPVWESDFRQRVQPLGRGRAQNAHPVLKGIVLELTSRAQPLAPLVAGVSRLSALAGCSHAEKN